MQIDTGDAGNWPLFPLVAVRFGDTADVNEYIDFRIGPLTCQQGKWSNHRHSFPCLLKMHNPVVMVKLS